MMNHPTQNLHNSNNNYASQHSLTANPAKETRTFEVQFEHGILYLDVMIQQRYVRFEEKASQAPAQAIKAPQSHENDNDDWMPDPDDDCEAVIENVQRVQVNGKGAIIRWDYRTQDSGEKISQFSDLEGDKSYFLYQMLSKLLSREIREGSSLNHLQWDQFVGRRVRIRVTKRENKKFARLLSVLS